MYHIGEVKSIELSKICHDQSIGNTVKSRNRILDSENPLPTDPDKKLTVWTARNFSTPFHGEKFWRFRGDPASNLEKLRKFEGPAEITLQPRHELPNKNNGLISRTTKVSHPLPKKYIRRQSDQYKNQVQPAVDKFRWS